MSLVERGLDDQHKRARAAIKSMAESQPDRWWDARELRKAAWYGPGDVAMFALTDLVNEGVLVLDARLRVRSNLGGYAIRGDAA